MRFVISSLSRSFFVDAFQCEVWCGALFSEIYKYIFTNIIEDALIFPDFHAAKGCHESIRTAAGEHAASGGYVHRICYVSDDIDPPDAYYIIQQQVYSIAGCQISLFTDCPKRSRDILR